MEERLRQKVSGSRSLLLWMLPVLSGILAWASFPKINQGYLSWVALVPLLWFAIEARNAAAAFLGGMIAGAVKFLGLIYWIPPVLYHFGGLPPAGAWALFLVLVLGLSCFSACVCALTHFGVKRGGLPYLFLFVPAWVASEYLRAYFPFGGFPWLLTGYSQTRYLTLIQIADLAGVYGVSFLVVAANAALAWALVFRGRRWIRTAPAAAVVVAVALSLSYGAGALRRWDRIVPGKRVAMLQGNLSIDEPESELARRYVQGYADMADHLGQEPVDLLVLPESPAPVIYQYDQAYRDAMHALARRFPLGMVFNNIGYREQGGAERYFNSAFFLDGKGRDLGRYDKMHLVPFGEYIPLKQLFFFSETVSRDVGDFAFGDRYTIVPMGGHTVSALICFEAVFPELSRQFVRRGSQLIINLTNDGWYGDTSAPYQHLEMARWRAIENRRYLLRAANSGISAVITPSGRITAQTGLLRRDTAVGGFAFIAEQTFWVRLGGLFPIVCAIITVLAIAWILFGLRPDSGRES